MTSLGCRSGVHWTRENAASSMQRAIARASTVLPVPGHVLEQHVPLARESGQDELQLLALPAQHRFDPRRESLGDAYGFVQPRRSTRVRR